MRLGEIVTCAGTTKKKRPQVKRFNALVSQFPAPKESKYTLRNASTKTHVDSKREVRKRLFPCGKIYRGCVSPTTRYPLFYTLSLVVIFRRERERICKGLREELSPGGCSRRKVSSACALHVSTLSARVNRKESTDLHGLRRGFACAENNRP